MSKAEISIALVREGMKSYLFDYLDWCKEQGMTYEQTKQRENAMQYGWHLHLQGIELNELQIAELYA